MQRSCPPRGSPKLQAHRERVLQQSARSKRACRRPRAVRARPSRYQRRPQRAVDAHTASASAIKHNAECYDQRASQCRPARRPAGGGGRPCGRLRARVRAARAGPGPRARGARGVACRPGYAMVGLCQRAAGDGGRGRGGRSAGDGGRRAGPPRGLAPGRSK